MSEPNDLKLITPAYALGVIAQWNPDAAPNEEGGLGIMEAIDLAQTALTNMQGERQMNTPAKRVFITVQGGVAYNDEEKSDVEVAVLILDFDNDPECAICEQRIKNDDAWAFSDAHNDFVHAACLHGDPMTDAEYVAEGGSLCPYCRSNQIIAGDSDSDGTAYEMEIHCNACDKDWFDHYKLMGYHA